MSVGEKSSIISSSTFSSDHSCWTISKASHSACEETNRTKLFIYKQYFTLNKIKYNLEIIKQKNQNDASRFESRLFDRDWPP